MRISRRDLFKFAGAGAAALLIPSTTFFLPPRCGWGAQRMKIRRVQHYLINFDTEQFRYDGTWDLPNGQGVQYRIDVSPVYGFITPEILAHQDKTARDMLERIMVRQGGTPNSSQFKLEMPRGLVSGAYI